MTGEMYASDLTEEAYPLHFAIAKACNGEVKPFDQYQGPYVAIGGDVTAGQAPYAIPVQLPGIVRLWLISDGDGFATVWNEDTRQSSEEFPEDDPLSDVLAVNAAESVLSE